MQRFIFSLLIVATLFSCSKEKTGTTNSPYAGNWSGTYTGTQDHGTWTAVITSDGKVTGNIVSLTEDDLTATMTGTVTNAGVFSATFTNSVGSGTFTGNASGTSASGTWQIPAYSLTGSWTGTLAP